MIKIKKILIIIGTIVLAAGVIAYLVFGRSVNKLSTTGGGGKGQERFSGSLKAAIALGVPMKCTYSVNGMEAEGYVKGEMYAGKTMVEGKVGHVIVKDDCMWSWDDESGQGITICYDKSDLEDQNAEGGDVWEQSQVDTGNVEYSCMPAAVGDDVFTPPADVNFMDMGEMMENLPSGMQEMMQ